MVSVLISQSGLFFDGPLFKLSVSRIFGGSLKAGAFIVADCSYGLQILHRATIIILVLRILLHQRSFEAFEEGRDQGLLLENLLKHKCSKTPSIPQKGLGFHNPLQILLGSCKCGALQCFTLQ